MKEFLLDGIDDYKIMSQEGVKQFVFPLDSMHNAIWDSTLMPDGYLYFSLATELSTAGYTRLYRYHYSSNAVEELFKVEDIIMPSDRAIRASKFHTSICRMNDGRFVMTTHTTDKSPAHPTWMPVNYYHHLWEGYAGSNIVVYDPKTKKAENLGIPVPHESIYGALYDAKHNALFFTGYMKGHLYRYDFNNGEIKDFGQTSENFAFRLLHDGCGNIIGSSRSGWYYSVNTDTLEITDLEYRPPFQIYPEYSIIFNPLSNGAIGPDGRLYMYPCYSRQFIAYDPKTQTFEEMGDYLPAENHARGETRNGVFGCDFDSQGVLWYAVFSRNCESGRMETGLPSSLFRWDIARGGTPEWMGLIGTKERTACWTSEICISEDDIMYIIGSNHAMDGPDITAVDLTKYRSTMRNFGNEITEDPYYVTPQTERYRKMGEVFYERIKIGEKNDWHVPMPLAYEPIRLWRALAPNYIDDSSVEMLHWQDNSTILGICGTKNKFVFQITDGRLKSIVPANKDVDLYNMLVSKKTDPNTFEGSILPYYPGRQYKAMPTACTSLSGKRTLMGTLDGMLAIIDENGGSFGLGPAAYNGPIRGLTSLPDKTEAYGVGGDVDDIGILFHYSDATGLRWLGHVAYDAPVVFGPINCTLLTSCTLNPCGEILAVGSGDRLGTLMFYKTTEQGQKEG